MNTCRRAISWEPLRMLPCPSLGASLLLSKRSPGRSISLGNISVVLLQIASAMLAKILQWTQLRRVQGQTTQERMLQGLGAELAQYPHKVTTAPKSSCKQIIKYNIKKPKKSSGCCHQELNIFCCNQCGRENTGLFPEFLTLKAGTERTSTITMVISYFLTTQRPFGYPGIIIVGNFWGFNRYYNVGPIMLPKSAGKDWSCLDIHCYYERTLQKELVYVTHISWR